MTSRNPLWRLSVKVGDIVRLKGSFASKKIGMLIAKDEFSPGWHTVVCGNEEIHWPEDVMVVISESR